MKPQKSYYTLTEPKNVIYYNLKLPDTRLTQGPHNMRLTFQYHWFFNKFMRNHNRKEILDHAKTSDTFVVYLSRSTQQSWCQVDLVQQMGFREKECFNRFFRILRMGIHQVPGFTLWRNLSFTKEQLNFRQNFWCGHDDFNVPL